MSWDLGERDWGRVVRKNWVELENGLVRLSCDDLGRQPKPVRIVFDKLGLEWWPGILLVPDLKPTDFVDNVGAEGNVVFILGFGINVLNDNIDCLSYVALLKIGIPQKIDILENLRRFEVVREDLLRGQGLGEVRVRYYRGGKERETSCNEARRSHVD